MEVFNSVLITFTFILQLQQIMTDSLLNLKKLSAPPFHATDNRLMNNTFLIRKCCGRGQVYNLNREENVANRRERCVKYSITDHHSSSAIEDLNQIFFGHEQHLPSGYKLENFEVDTGFPSNCEPDLLLEPDMRMADLFYPIASGQLLVPHRFWLLQFEDHCIEDYFENESFMKPRRVAFICTPHITKFPVTAIDSKGKLHLNFIDASIIPAELSSAGERKVIPKCCDRNEIYSLANWQCIENQGFATHFFDNPQFTRKDEIFFRFGLPDCDWQNTNEFNLTSNGSLEIMGNARSGSSDQLVPIEHYCIEDMEYYDSVGLPVTSNQAFFCSDLHNPDQYATELTIPEIPIDSGIGTLNDIDYNNSIIINAPKCCPIGHIMNENVTCQPLKLQKHSLDVDFIISQSLNNYFLRSHKIVTNLIPNNLSSSCELIRINKTDPELVKFEGDAKNELSFSFHYQLENYFDFKIQPKPFCVDLGTFRDEKEVSHLPHIYYCKTPTHVSIHYPILLCISAAGLIVTFIIYFFVPTSGSAKLVTSAFGAGSRKTRTPTMATLLTGRILLCHIFTLSLTFICLAIVHREHFAPTETSCVVAGYVIYGASISSFAWLTVYCFDYYRIFSGSFKVSNEMLFIPYSIFGWGVPVLAIIAATVTQFRSTVLGISDTVNPNMGLFSCWFPSGGNSALVFFYAPVGALLLLDIICFLSLIFNPNLMQCWKKKQGLKIRVNRKVSREQQDFKMAIKLFFITGIPWVFEVAAWLPVYLSIEPAFFQSIKYVFEISNLLNSLRGVIIFIIFIILQRDVRHFLSLRLKKIFNKDTSINNITLPHSRTNTDGDGDPSVSTQQTNNRRTSQSLTASDEGELSSNTDGNSSVSVQQSNNRRSSKKFTTSEEGEHNVNEHSETEFVEISIL